MNESDILELCEIVEQLQASNAQLEKEQSLLLMKLDEEKKNSVKWIEKINEQKNLIISLEESVAQLSVDLLEIHEKNDKTELLNKNLLQNLQTHAQVELQLVQ